MNDQSETPRIKGHAISQMARTVYAGEPRSGAHFINWQQPEPAAVPQRG